MAKQGKIKRYNQLFEYLEKDKKHYFVEKYYSSKKLVISVYLKGPSGKMLSVVDKNHSGQLRLCKYTFKDIEVSRPELTIDGDTIQALVETLLLDPNIFDY